MTNTPETLARENGGQMRTIGADILRVVLDHERTCMHYLDEYRIKDKPPEYIERHAEYLRRAKELSAWTVAEFMKQYATKDE
jgi:hypothetical protein